MNADAARIGEIAASTEARLSDPDDERDQVIDRIARLLSSGQSIPEILQNIKLTAEGNGATPSKGAAEPDGQTIHLPVDLRDSRSDSETIQSPEPLNETVAHAKPTAADTVDLGASGGQESAQAAPVSRTRLAKSLTLVRSALFLAFPVGSLAVLALAGNSLIGSDAVPNAFATVTKALTKTVQFRENSPGLQTAEADERAVSSLIAESASVKPQPVEPDHAEPQTAAAQTTPSDRPVPQTAQPDRGQSHLTSQQIKALLDRGDALISRAEIEAARLSYEQAVVAGNAEAALRLGATYDPAFLAQAGLQNVRGDATTAQYWYQRARDLKRNPAQLSSPEARN